MIPIIRVFVDNDVLIKKFENAGYIVYVDSVHYGDFSWRDEYYSKSFWGGYADMNAVRRNSPFPDFIVSNDDEIDRECCNLWVKSIDIGEDTGYFEKPPKLESLVHSENGGHRYIPPEYVVLEEPYLYREFIDESKDIGYFEVTRPGALPFTVVVFPFTEKGRDYFFTDICGSDDWMRNYRECRYDFWFLQQKYEEWNGKVLTQDGFDEMLEVRVKSCFPDVNNDFQPCVEPMVYRRKLENVRETLRERGFGRVGH